MKETFYLRLRLKILARRIEEFGLNSYLTILGVLVLSAYLLDVILDSYYGVYLSYIAYLGISFSVLKHSDLDILKMNIRSVQAIFLFESLLVAVGFIVINLLNGYYFSSGIYLLSGVCFSFFPFKYKFGFSKKINLSFLMPDYEWIYGFRKHLFYLVLFVLVYLMGFIVSNFNISLFGVLGFFIILGNFYSVLEKKELILAHSIEPKIFIGKKILSVLKKNVIILGVLVLPLFLNAQLNLWETISMLIALNFLVINQMLSKYTFYFNSINIGLNQGIILIIGLLGCFFPFFIILSVVHFYYLQYRAVKEFQKLLYVKN